MPHDKNTIDLVSSVIYDKLTVQNILEKKKNLVENQNSITLVLFSNRYPSVWEIFQDFFNKYKLLWFLLKQHSEIKND